MFPYKPRTRLRASHHHCATWRDALSAVCRCMVGALPRNDGRDGPEALRMGRTQLWLIGGLHCASDWTAASAVAWSRLITGGPASPLEDNGHCRASWSDAPVHMRQRRRLSAFSRNELFYWPVYQPRDSIRGLGLTTVNGSIIYIIDRTTTVAYNSCHFIGNLHC